VKYGIFNPEKSPVNPLIDMESEVLDFEILNNAEKIYISLWKSEVRGLKILKNPQKIPLSM
jgi:hypothetical protein